MRPKPKRHRRQRWLRHRVELAIVKAAVWFVPKLSRANVHRIGRCLGWIAYSVMRETRQISCANLNLVFGDTKSPQEKRRVARASFQNFAATLLGLFWAPRLSRENIREFVEVDIPGLEQVVRIRAARRGIIFVTLHYGDWELLSLATGFLDLSATIVTENMTNIRVGEVFRRLRGRSGHQVLLQHGVAKKLLKTLLRGECVAMLIDLNATPRSRGVWLDFFGLPVFNHAAVAALALRSGAAIICAYAQPLPDGRTRLIYGPEISYKRTEDREADAQRINQQCLDWCATIIRQQPEHWLWSYKRWKFKPADRDDLYPYYARIAWF